MSFGALNTTQRGGQEWDFTRVDQSCWVDGSADYLSRTLTASGTNNTWTLSFRFRLGTLTTSAMVLWQAGTSSRDVIWLQSNQVRYSFAGGAKFGTSTQVLRDSEWYHLAFICTAGSLSVRLNGVEILTNTGVTLDRAITSGQTIYWGYSNAELYFNGKYAQCTFLNNYAANIEELGEWWLFGENGEEWAPLADADMEALAFAAGGISYCLTSGIGDGTDASGLGNHFTPTSMSHAANGSDDTPSNVYALFNLRRPAITGKTYSEGVRKVTSTSNFGNGNILASLPFQAGLKYYWEIRDFAAASNQSYGVAKTDAPAAAGGIGHADKAWGFYNNEYQHNGVRTAIPDSPSNTATVYMFALDTVDGKLWFGSDGTWWKSSGGSTAGNPAAGSDPAFTDVDLTGGDIYAALDLWSASDAATIRFTESEWSYSPPAGFVALCTANLPTGVVPSSPDTGSFAGNASTDGPNVYLGYSPSASDALTINGNAVTWGTHARITAHGFKVISSSSSYNTSGSNTYSLVTTNAVAGNGELPPIPGR